MGCISRQSYKKLYKAFIYIYIYTHTLVQVVSGEVSTSADPVELI